MVAHNNTASLFIYAIQNSFILLAPVFFAASIYMTLSRIIRGVQADHLSPIRPTRLTKIFVTGDITALMIQGGSAGLMIIAEYAKIGQAIVIVGLVFHICVFALFIALTAIFHRRLRALGAPKLATSRDAADPTALIYMLYICSGLIMFRSIFRVIEFAMGMDGYLLVNEWPLYVFDSLPMVVVTVAFWWWFPSGLLPMGSADGSMQLVEASQA